MSNDAAPSDRDWRPEVLRDLLTADRLRSYLSDCAQDLDQALRLYEWNLTAAAAVMQTSAIVEVIIRNAFDRELVRWAHGRGQRPWLEIVPLDNRGKADIAKAYDRATDYGKAPLNHGKVVAELNFGFWRYLAARRYHASLWVPALHNAFPNGNPDLSNRRREVESHLSDLMLVRNRAAHHEPIHRRNLKKDLTSAIELTAWVHPDAGAWLAATSTLPIALSAKPPQG